MKQLQRCLALLSCSALALGCGALDGKRGGEGLECFGIADCGPHLVCFLGSCVDPGYSISTVYAELQPPNNSPWLPQQLEKLLSLEDGLQELPLRPAALLEGAMLQTNSTATLHGSIVASRRGPIREVIRQGLVTENLFSFRVVPNTYDLKFTPAALEGHEQALPSISLGSLQVSSDLVAEFTYPSLDEMLTLKGRLTSSVDISTWVSGALVSASAVAANELLPQRTLESTVGITDDDGRFQVVFSENAHTFNVTIKPGNNPLVPEMTFENVPLSGEPGELEALSLGLGPTRIVPFKVLDAAGAPLDGVTVIFAGQVGSVQQGRYVVNALTNDLGEAQINDKAPELLTPGVYTITVLPRRAQAASIAHLTTSLETMPDSITPEPIVVHLGTKVDVSGKISAHDDSLVSNARLTFTLRHPNISRQFTAATSENGSYTIALDPSTNGFAADYELVIEPDGASGLPRHRELVRVGTSNSVLNIRLHQPTFIYGRVVDGSGMPVPETLVTFYAPEGGVFAGPLLVGVGQSNQSGEFVIPLPNP